jgi:hypothetical protein
LLEGADTPPPQSINGNVTATTWGVALDHCTIDNRVGIINQFINGYSLPPGPGEANHFGIIDLIVP